MGKLTGNDFRNEFLKSLNILAPRIAAAIERYGEDTVDVVNFVSSGTATLNNVSITGLTDIVSTATTDDVLDITADSLTTANVIDISADALTTGTILNLVSDSSDTSARTLVTVKNDNTAATGTVVMHLVNDAIGGYDDPILLIESTADETHPVLELKNSNASTTGEPILVFTRSDSSAEADDMSLGTMIFRGVDSGNANEYYAQIKTYASDVTAGDEGGLMTFVVKAGGTAGTAANTNLFAIGGEDVANTVLPSVVVNEDGINCDFRVEGDTETHLIFADASVDRVSIGVSTDAPAATLEISNASDGGVPLVLLASNDTDKICLDIDAANIDADVIDIAADAVTTAFVMDVTADGLTTGGILNLVSDSSSTGTRSLVTIKNDNTAATATTLLHLINDSTSASADMIIESTDADAAAAPKINFLRNSASPAVDDVLGKVLFSGKDDAGNTTLYASVRAEINDETDSGGQEDGVIVFEIIKNNSQKSALELKNNEAVFNNSGADIDFRVESDDNTHVFFIDGNDNTIAAAGRDATNHKDGFAVFNDFNGTTFESTLADGQFGSAEILRYSPGADDTLTAGQLYFLHTDGTWDQTDADAVATGATQLLGIGLGGSARTVGVATRGYIRIPSSEILNLPGSGACDGLPVYISTTAGHLDFTAPTGTGDFVRVVGYAIDDDSSDVLVYINPSATHVELA